MAQNTICLDTELRKLRPAELCTLAQILNISDSWKKLMAIIPKDDTSGLPKFNTDHFSMIEQATQQQRRNAAEIFLVEWGTMGKARPTLRVLLKFLVKAELFRAADYVAGDLLKEELPKRPKYGPAAPVDISEELLQKLLEETDEELNTNFNESLIFELASEANNDKMISPNAVNDDSLERNLQSTKLISTKERHNKEYLEDVGKNDIQQQYVKVSNVQVSDLMKFSVDEYNIEEYRTHDNPPAAAERVNTLNVESNTPQECIFEKQEMASHELPVFLNEFRTTVDNIHLNQEVMSDELPVVLNNNSGTLSIHNDFTNESMNSSQLDISRNEMASIELPQCIADLREKSETNLDTNNIAKAVKDVVKSALSSQELPITVLEYNQ